MEFHVSRRARDMYDFDQALFSLSGNVLFANFRNAREFVRKMNEKRDLIRFPERAMQASQINALGLIDEVLHLIVELYRRQVNPRVMEDAYRHVVDTLGEDTVDRTLSQFAEQFPPLSVYRQERDLADYLEGETDGRPNRVSLLEELILLWLANVNPAFAPYMELFNDEELDRETAYPAVLGELAAYFETQATFGPDDEPLVDMLRSPAVAVPHSLSGQLEFIRRKWGHLLGEHLYRLLTGMDFIREEERLFFLGAGPSRVYEYGAQELEPERFSPDQDWMPRVVLLAKNVFVWLDQLSSRYGRAIRRLDQIPAEELDRLSEWGFTGLWLIGLWERSPASRQIKALTGNPDAVASAYSLFEYRIADALGGEPALNALRDMAWQRGIRLSSDMVPNHMGIDSRWLIEHPDWFIYLKHSPFPSYSFTGPDLSWDDRVAIHLEDHYYDRSDAAVVFERVDRHTGDVRYVYHGNDGTSMPWNDTAQIDFLHAEAREAVIQTILHVARAFPIIRFDAAMTLAKRHYQRLWFPAPGTGGAIPSRSEFGLTRDEFDELMPTEFWREVVDRVAAEAPDTLLLAEAFWLMEGYFVRTLGMHRVYNSAFMNMLRDEENANYRSVMKNTLEFDPEILKRFVNFMNNPDERTAVDQFGKGDKYFGVCTMLATMPGLPMVGHGQIEGYAEKYGMEFHRPQWDEQPDQALIDRHRREIFPLLRRRELFSGVENFLLYDFFTPEGFVNEDVFAYSNRYEGKRSLVVYHNRFNDTRGWIRSSVAYAVKEGDQRRLAQHTLGEGLNLPRGDRQFVAFRDPNRGLEYLRSCQEIHEKGLFLELEAYTYRVLIDFKEIEDNEWHLYTQLNDYLNGRGVPSIEEAAREIFLRPVQTPYRDLVNAGMLRWLWENRPEEPEEELPESVVSEVREKLGRLRREIRGFVDGEEGTAGAEHDLIEIVLPRLNAALRLPGLRTGVFDPGVSETLGAIQTNLNGESNAWGVLLSWVFSHHLGGVVRPEAAGAQSRAWVDEWQLGKILTSTLRELGREPGRAERDVQLIKALISHQSWPRALGDTSEPLAARVEEWLQDLEVQALLQVNRYQGALWFNQEAMEAWLRWLGTIGVVQWLAEEQEPLEAHLPALAAATARIERAAAESGYRLEAFLETLREETGSSAEEKPPAK